MSFLKDKNPKGATDILKVIIVFTLPFIHALGNIASFGFYTEELATLKGILAISIFGATVFMICMGIDLFENRSYKSIIKTGIIISLINMVFNLVRYVVPEIPMMIAGLMPVLTTIIKEIAAGDIYAFIGLFCIFYGLAKKFKWSLGACTIASIALFALNLFLGYHKVELSTIPAYYLGNFITGYGGTTYALFGFSIFPFIGMYIKKCMRLEKVKRDRAFGLIFLGAIAGLIILMFVMKAMGTSIIEVMMLFFFDQVYGINQMLVMVLFSALSVALIYFIYEMIPKNGLEKKLLMWSNLVMPFYLIHLVIINWITVGGEFLLIATGHDPVIYSVAGFLALSIGTLVVTAIICWKKGFAFTRWLFKVFDYQRWFKKKKA